MRKISTLEGMLVFALAAEFAGSVPADAAVATRIIYRCESGGVVTFADHPCGSEAQQYEADTSRISTYEPAPVTAMDGRAQRAPARQRPAARKSGGVDPARHAAACTRIKEGLADIRSKMRSGYGVKEGERLKARQAKLSQRARVEKCR